MQSVRPGAAVNTASAPGSSGPSTPSGQARNAASPAMTAGNASTTATGAPSGSALDPSLLQQARASTPANASTLNQAQSRPPPVTGQPAGRGQQPIRPATPPVPAAAAPPAPGAAKPPAPANPTAPPSNRPPAPAPNAEAGPSNPANANVIPNNASMAAAQQPIPNQPLANQPSNTLQGLPPPRPFNLSLPPQRNFAPPQPAPPPPPPAPIEKESDRRKRKFKEYLEEEAPGLEMETGVHQVSDPRARLATQREARCWSVEWSPTRTRSSTTCSKHSSMRLWRARSACPSIARRARSRSRTWR